MSSSIPSWQILTAHAQPFRGARDLAFCLKVPLDSVLVWASSRGSGETARMGRLAWTLAACICDKDQIRLTRPKCNINQTPNWASSWENQSYAICKQQRHSSAFASMQSDQRLCCSLPGPVPAKWATPVETRLRVADRLWGERTSDVVKTDSQTISAWMDTEFF